MNQALIMVLAVCVAASCATVPPHEVSTPAGAAPVLRLLDITPRDGSAVDSATVLVARLAYYIPDFDAGRTYVVSAVFTGVGGGTFNRGGGHAPIRVPAGIATVRHSMQALWSGIPRKPSSPLTGSFVLLEHDSLTMVQDTFQVGDRIRIRTATSRASVRARSRTFYFNGAGPARSLAAGLPDVLEEYWTYRPHKALAIAYDSPSRWAYGYAYGLPSRDAAAERALDECHTAAEQRKVDSPCQIVAVDEQEAETQATSQR